MKPVLYTQYPVFSIITYNGITVLHFLLGGVGLMLGYNTGWGSWLGAAYLALAFFEMYVLMPFRVCPNCPYYKLKESRCISGLNLIAQNLAKEGRIDNFGKRARGALCSNNLYIAGFVFPIIALIPALVLNFSYIVLGILLGMVALLAFRFFVLFPKVACGHCRAKNICPNARSMKLDKVS